MGDSTSPRQAVSTPPALDELVEGTEVTLGQAADEAELVANLLCDAFGVELGLGTVTPGWPALVRLEADRRAMASADEVIEVVPACSSDRRADRARDS